MRQNRLSLETLMKWIFLMLALSMAALILGARLHQCCAQKTASVLKHGREVKIIFTKKHMRSGEGLLLGKLGAYWMKAADGEKPMLVIDSGTGEKYYFTVNRRAILVSCVESERYLLLIGLLGLIAAVETAVFISYILIRPLRRLAWGCKEISDGITVTIPQDFFSASEFSELTDSFNNMAIELEHWKEAQRQMSRMGRLAVLGEMLSGLAHEIRNPLASMRIQMDLLRTDPSVSPDAIENIDIVNSELDRLNGIVTQLLSFVRPKQAVMTPVKLDNLLPWSAALFREQAVKKNIEFTTKCVDKDIIVMADASMLKQIIMNLTLNAVQAMSQIAEPRVKRIALSVSRTGAEDANPFMGVIEVRDSGPGIPKEAQYRVFDPFYTTRKEGTGLGLSLVQQIVEGHNGKISLRSSGEGTDFRIYIPLYRMNESAAEERCHTDESVDN